MSGKRLLVLNVEVSGINKYLLSQLEKRGWKLLVVNVPLPEITRYWAMLLTFRLPVGRWKKAFSIKLDKLYKSSWCFRWRTRVCEQIIKQHQGRFDVILNVAGMFAPTLRSDGAPYITFNDYTMKLALKYPPWSSPKNEIDKWLALERRLYANAKKIFACSENTKSSMIRDYDVSPGKVIVSGYGQTFDMMKEDEKKYDGKTILFVGFDFERKGGFVLLKAFKKAREKIPDARLIIIGPSSQMYQINQEGVDFIGPVHDRDVVRKYFKRASVFVMPSLCEPFGLVFLEAMGYRLPCIGTDIDAGPEIIQDKETGYIVRPNDADDLAEKICLLLGDENRMRRMGENGFKRVCEKYTWDRVGETIDTHLMDIVNFTGKKQPGREFRGLAVSRF